MQFFDNRRVSLEPLVLYLAAAQGFPLRSETGGSHWVFCCSLALGALSEGDFDAGFSLC